MSNSIFHVRPLDSGKGWAIDEYDGRGAWQHSVPIGPDGAPMDKIQAQRAVFQLRRKAVNSAKPKPPVNKDGMYPPSTRVYSGQDMVGDSSDEDASPRQRTTSADECAAVADSNNPSELVRVAHQHWDRIGWPEDAKPIALLERAITILDGSTVIRTAKVAL